MLTLAKNNISLHDLNHLASTLAPYLIPGDCICLEGDLGVGKTTLSQYLIKKLTNDEYLHIPSPTFTLINMYDSQKGPIYHCDFYRLNAPEDALEVGYEEFLHTGICIIEWPQKLGYLYPVNSLNIQMELNSHGDYALSIELKETDALHHLKPWFVSIS
jgi:tRNA threonylcarbamoyl adenosine modification protein YjeE